MVVRIKAAALPPPSITTTQADIRVAEALLSSGRGDLEQINAFKDCSHGEKLDHPVLHQIPFRSMLGRSKPPRPKGDVLHLTESIQKVSENDVSFRTFHASSEELPDNWLVSLSQALRHNTVLERIMFNNNQVEQMGTQAIARALESNGTVIELNLGGNMIGDYGAQAFGDMLKVNHTLMSLNLAGRKPAYFQWRASDGHRITPLGAGSLGIALETNTSLTSLSLSDQRILDVGAAALARALRLNRTLSMLVLCKNKINDPGAKALAHALEKNQGLLSLDLRGNEIGDEGSQGFAMGLEGNKTLTALDLSDNHIGQDGADHLLSLLVHTNPYIRHMSLVDNPVPVKSMLAIDDLITKRNASQAIRYSLVEGQDFEDRYKGTSWPRFATRYYPPKTDGPIEYQLPVGMVIECTLPSPQKTKGEPPVAYVTRQNRKLQRLAERKELGKTPAFKRWKSSMLHSHRRMILKDEWPIKDAWYGWRSHLLRRYPLGIDHGRESYREAHFHDDELKPPEPILRYQDFENPTYPRTSSRGGRRSLGGVGSPMSPSRLRFNPPSSPMRRSPIKRSPTTTIRIASPKSPSPSRPSPTAGVASPPPTSPTRLLMSPKAAKILKLDPTPKKNRWKPDF